MAPISSSTSPFMVKPGLATQPSLAEASGLLACAMASAYENADRHNGSARHAALAVVHLVEMAKALVDATLENAQHAESGRPKTKTT